MITLGSNIKKYRKDRKITQEQLAEVLGVSDQAVSRWENCTTYPDIELLPTIAHYFGVTMDELMGMEAYKDESDIAEILKKREELRNRGEVVKSYEMLRKAVKRYPKNYELLSALVADLCFANVYNEEIRLNNLHEAERLIDRILAECQDEQICRNMIGEKVYLLNWLERTDEAVALAEKALPEMKDARESYLKHILTGEKKRAFCRQYMMDLYFEMWLTISEYADENCEDDSVTLPERIALLKKAIALTEWLFEGNYGLNNWQMSYWHEYIASYEAKLKNAEAALTHLEAAAEHVIACDTLPEEVPFTSTLLRGETFRLEENAKNYTHSECDSLAGWMGGKDFDFIREDERFKAVEAKIAKYRTN